MQLAILTSVISCATFSSLPLKWFLALNRLQILVRSAMTLCALWWNVSRNSTLWSPLVQEMSVFVVVTVLLLCFLAPTPSTSEPQPSTSSAADDMESGSAADVEIGHLHGKKVTYVSLWTSLFAKPGNKTDREQTIYTKKSKKQNNKITEMHTNIIHSHERLTRQCEWHQIYDKTQNWIK